MITFALALDIFTQLSFWVSVGVLAGTYGIFACGLQLNVGFTGVVNFGQAGFMAIGAYTMGIAVVELGWSFWAALPVAVLVAMAAGLLIGLSSLRLRADYFAIVTLAFAEIVRYTAINARDLTGGNQGLIGFDGDWARLSGGIQEALAPVGLDGEFLLPLLLVTWTTLVLL
ncbi:MAG: branched-chain amino acid ABC transporter permease, partial [Acidobacteria bacterium]|nr:branched-chain amino acid ABC transporter permease [Acidobacteriota bacterium]